MTTTPAAEPRLIDKIGQFVTIPHSFINDMCNLTPAAVSLFMYLRYKTNSHTDRAFPSYERMIEETGMARATISAGMKVLIKRGWIKTRRRFSNSTIYEICIPSISSKIELMEAKSDAPLVQKLNCISSEIELPLVQKLNSIKSNISRKNYQQQDAGASNAAADFYLSIWNELKTHGITRNKKTSEIVKRFASCEHALDIIRAEAKNIGNDKKNKAGVLVDLLANFDIATYTPPVKQVFRVIDEEY